MKFRSLLIFMLALFAPVLAPFSAPVLAQGQPNSLGVVFHNISFEVPDYDANVDFWTKFGLTQQQPAPQPATGSARFAVFHAPNSDVAITVQEDKTASGGSVGTVLDHIGFQVPDVPPAIEKWKAAGLRTEPGARPQQSYVYTPDNVKVEILQDATLTVPLKPHHIHFFNASPLDTQAWYVKMFGAVPGKRGNFDAADAPNINLTFSKADGATTPSKGHALSHIGFGVANVAQFKKDLEAKGVVFDPAMQPKPGTGPQRIAFFVDPWGTTIELFQLSAPTNN